MLTNASNTFTVPLLTAALAAKERFDEVRRGERGASPVEYVLYLSAAIAIGVAVWKIVENLIIDSAKELEVEYDVESE